jgi:magnesium transporter
MARLCHLHAQQPAEREHPGGSHRATRNGPATTVAEGARGDLDHHEREHRRVARRLWHRLPWLLVGLLGAMGAIAIIGGFKGQLEANVLLAFFIPAVVYMADAVGTQTETVLIRALSAGITVRSVLRRELVTGLVMGVVIGAAFLIFALIGWGDADVAAAVALAMLASCSIATVVAMALPALFQRLGLDPAFGCGPLATVLQDLLSIAVYLAIVVAVVV